MKFWKYVIVKKKRKRKTLLKMIFNHIFFSASSLYFMKIITMATKQENETQFWPFLMILNTFFNFGILLWPLQIFSEAIFRIHISKILTHNLYREYFSHRCENLKKFCFLNLNCYSLNHTSIDQKFNFDFISWI